ncbi:hypothetical protein L345_02197, partial [Ophiophagus hannah]
MFKKKGTSKGVISCKSISDVYISLPSRAAGAESSLSLGITEVPAFFCYLHVERENFKNCQPPDEAKILLFTSFHKIGQQVTFAFDKNVPSTHKAEAILFQDKVSFLHYLKRKLVTYLKSLPDFQEGRVYRQTALIIKLLNTFFLLGTLLKCCTTDRRPLKPSKLTAIIWERELRVNIYDINTTTKSKIHIDKTELYDENPSFTNS